jgi:ferrous iron transport protein A
MGFRPRADIDIDFQLRFATVKGMGSTDTLAATPIGERVRIASVDLDQDSAAWLAAVGLHPGEELVVLRRGALGGPLHVRTSSGGEFAVSRDIADAIAVRPAVPLEAVPE